MSSLLYGIRLQFWMDIRSRALLITCYLVPLLFFAVMGGVFTSLMPEAKETLTASMTVMGVSMGALIGVPPSVHEIYGSGIRRMYRAGGAPECFGLVTLGASAFVHLMIMSLIIYFAAEALFGAQPPRRTALYFASLSLFIFVSLCAGCLLGLAARDQARLTMLCQTAFLPSIMLSGILFPAELLPAALRCLGKALPASWAYRLLAQSGEYALSAALLAAFLPCGACLGALLLHRGRLPIDR